MAEITELVPPKMKREVIKVTSHDSPNGYDEFIAGMRDGGECSMKANWLPTDASHQAVLDSFNDDSLHSWEIDVPLDPVYPITFNGFVTDFNTDLPLPAQADLSVTIKGSGKINFGS